MEIVQQQTVELLKGLSQLHNDLWLISIQLIVLAVIGAIVVVIMIVKS